jgi:serine/threonine-protein kinase
MTVNRLELLGGIAIKGPEGREIPAVLHQPKRFAVLTWLALHARSGYVRRDQLLGVLWPNHDAERARSALRQAVHFLRQHLGAETIVGRGDEDLGVDPARLACDAVSFEEALDRRALAEALALYRGELLPGFFLSEAPEFERWVEGTRDRLRARAVAAAWELCQSRPATDDAAVAWARQAVAMAPNDESGVRRLIQLLLARGDRAGAVEAYEGLARRLREDLDLVPSAATDALLVDARRAPASRPDASAVAGSPTSVAPPHAGSSAAPAQGPSVSTSNSESLHDAFVADAPGPGHAIAAVLGRPRDGGAASSARVVRRAVWWRLGAVGAAVGIGLLVWQRASRSSPPVDPDLIAVAPFDVLDASLHLWEAGMASVLSANLDGAGPLRASPPSTTIRRWRGPTDRSALGEFGRAMGAGLVLGGRLLRLRGDSVRLWGTLLSARTDEVLIDTELDGAEANLAVMADSLTLRVLRALGRERAIGVVRRTSIGSTSMPALRAFLRGEQFYRVTSWDSALEYHRRAIAAESTFAPALRRVGDDMSWIGTIYDDSSNIYRLKAGRHNRGLAVRESLLVQAESLFASLQGTEFDPAWWERRHRLSITLASAQRRYPDDAEIWNLAGEAAFHYGEHPTTDYARALSAFDRSIALDSAFTPAYVHSVSLATRLGDVRRARTYAGVLSRAAPSVTTSAARTFLAVTGATPNLDAWEAFRRDAGPGELFETWSALRDLGDSAEVSVQLMRQLAAGGWAHPPYSDSAFRVAFYARTLVTRGHVREAARFVPVSPDADVELAMVGVLRAEDADARFDAWVAARAPWTPVALPWWSGRRDTVRIQRYLATGGQAPGVGRASIGEAYLLLARGDSAGALRAFEALPDSACVACGHARLTRAQLLLAARQYRRAAALLASELLWIPREPPVASVLWDLSRGVAAEQLGDGDVARRAYQRVADMWQHADVELAPYVRQARDGLSRLKPRD